MHYHAILEWLVQNNLWKAAVAFWVTLVLGALLGLLLRPWRGFKRRRATQESIANSLDTGTPGGLSTVAERLQEVLNELRGGEAPDDNGTDPDKRLNIGHSVIPKPGDVRGEVVVAAKTPVSKKAVKATVAKKSTVHKAKPKGLVLSAAQWKAYNKAYNAAASAARTKIAFRASVGRLRKYRLNAAYGSMKAAAVGESAARAAAIAAYATRQSWRQSKLAHQNQALQNKIEQDMYNHATIAGRLQFAAAGEKAYAHRAIMRTLDESQANAYERKVFNAVTRTAKAAKKSVKYGKTQKPTAASKQIAAAGRAAGLRAAEAPGLVAAAKRAKAASQAKAHATASRTAKAHTKATLAAERAKRKGAHGAAAQSKKAPVAPSKARTSPQFGQPSRMSRFPKPKLVKWLGDEEQPLCIVYAVANHLLHIKNFRADDKALAELAELAGDEPTIEGTLWQVYLTGWPQGSLLHLTNYIPVEELRATLPLFPLVVGYEHAYEEDGKTRHADHAALSLPDGRVVTWGAVEKLAAEVEEAWDLRWDT